MTTSFELRQAEKELADIMQRERFYLGFLLALERQYPGSDDVARQFFRAVGIEDQTEIDRKTAAFLTLARAPRLAA